MVQYNVIILLQTTYTNYKNTIMEQMTVLITMLEQMTLLSASQYQQLQEDIFIIYLSHVINLPNRILFFIFHTVKKAIRPISYQYRFFTCEKYNQWALSRITH